MGDYAPLESCKLIWGPEYGEKTVLSSAQHGSHILSQKVPTLSEHTRPLKARASADFMPNLSMGPSIDFEHK